MPQSPHRLEFVSSRNSFDPYVQETPELDALVSTRSSVLTHEEILAKQGVVVLGNVLAQMQQVHFAASASAVDLKAAARCEEHAKLLDGFLKESIRELERGLTENFRLAHSQVKRVTGAGLPIDPPKREVQPTRHIVERRKLSWGERLTGQAWLEYEA